MKDYSEPDLQPWYGMDISRVVVGNGITSIGRYAFARLSNLTEVSLPESLIELNGYAFWKCRALSNLKIPDSVKLIGEDAFAYTGLTSIRIPEGITELSENLFFDCEKLSDVSLPKSLKTILSRVFAYCGTLRDLDIPDGVSSVDNYAFSNSGLKSIHLPSSLTYLGDYAFECCKKLEEVVVPEGVRSISDNTFKECTSLKTVAFLGVSYFGRAVKGLSSLQNLYLTKQRTVTVGALSGTRLANLYYAGSSAEWYKLSGMYIEVDSNYTKMTFNYTYGDKNEADFVGTVLPKGLKSISEEAFMNCKLQYVICPDGMQSIGSRAFADSQMLSIVEIPSSVTSIADDAFSGCGKIRIITTKGSAAADYANAHNFALTLE